MSQIIDFNIEHVLHKRFQLGLQAQRSGFFQETDYLILEPAVPAGWKTAGISRRPLGYGRCTAVSKRLRRGPPSP